MKISKAHGNKPIIKKKNIIITVNLITWKIGSIHNTITIDSPHKQIHITCNVKNYDE